MPGGLLQLVGKGAQDQLVVGSPSFTHFRSVYKRHTDFAMEHFRCYFKTSILSFPTTGTLRLRAKMEKYAQLLNDCYLSIDLPDIYSPVVPVTPPANSPINPQSNAIGYEFQWVRNVGYNMIHHVSVLLNGQEIVRHTGEWMKLYASMAFDANKKAILDRMVGNTPDLYDPAGDLNQYPHAISTSSSYAEPSLYGRTLLIPLHFWFCETVGQALPLVALQNSDVEIVVELRNAYTIFTTLDVNPARPTFGTRLAPDASDDRYTLSHFLSPPNYASPTTNVTPGLRSWNLNPFIEGNYIFIGDTELAYLARTEHSFILSQVDMVQAEGQYGPSNDLELTMKNLVTRIVWVAQRSDRIAANDVDNYTNWAEPYQSPFTPASLGWFSSGTAQPANVSQRDPLLESTLILDGKERYATKQTLFFSGLQMYRHQTGDPLPGVYEYSFALDNNPSQPSGHINGSMFNKTILRNTLVLPPYTEDAESGTNTLQQCILKSTATSATPVVIPAGQVGDYRPDEIVTVFKKAATTGTYKYTFTVRAYVQSYNFLRIMGGLGNVVFSS